MCGWYYFLHKYLLHLKPRVERLRDFATSSFYFKLVAIYRGVAKMWTLQFCFLRIAMQSFTNLFQITEPFSSSNYRACALFSYSKYRTCGLLSYSKYRLWELFFNLGTESVSYFLTQSTKSRSYFLLKSTESGSHFLSSKNRLREPFSSSIVTENMNYFLTLSSESVSHFLPLP